MEKSFDFNRLFGNASEAKSENKQIFKKAALMFEFNLKNDFSNFPKADIELLKIKANPRYDGMFTLSEDLNNSIIAEEIGFNNIVDEIDKNEIQSEFSKTLLKAIEIDIINYKSFSDSELFYLTKVSGLFPKKLDQEAIKNELQRRSFFSPFKKVIENFAGRENEIKKINEYIDWLPKEGFFNQASNIFRNAINWFDKPPLLIQGIGGIGKSTLISKIIIDNNNEKGRNILPFVYIDFDLPGFTIKEPLNILLECLRQLSIEFSAQQNILKAISQNVSDMINNSSNSFEDLVHTSNKSFRGLVFNSVEGIINKYSWGLDKINTPILIVFDSFEEMQFRASRDELDSFFSFVREISEKIPRIRPVFVGRSEISERLSDFKFDKIELLDFDQKSAIVLLNKFGLEDKKLCETIFEKFGGNPLLLQLAADLVKKDKEAVKDFNQIKEKKHEYLINRILDQIHNPDIRKIAVPGMLVRRITPEVIQEIFSEPCKLGNIGLSQAKKIYNELRKEVSLISKSSEGSELMFRQDLRMACEKMIWDKYPKESELIRQKSIDFYNQRKAESETNEAEYYYHILKKGEIPESLTKNVYDRIRTKIESSVIEFPEKVQLYINTLLSSRVSDQTIKNSSNVEWERYYLPQLKKGLNGELAFLKKLYVELNARKERSDLPDSTFPIYEALLYQRLNKLNQSNEVINHAIEIINAVPSRNYIDITSELMFIKSLNLEYVGKFEEALVVCKQNFPRENNPLNSNVLIKYEFLHKRLSNRCMGIESESDVSISNYIPNLDDEFIDTHWNYIFRNAVNQEFQSKKEFDINCMFYKRDVRGFQLLELQCQQSLDVFLKDITLIGEFEIVFRDFLYCLEATGRLNQISNIK